MILKFLLLISVFQLILCFLIDKLKFRSGKRLLLIGLVIGNVFIFPRFFYPEPSPEKVNCGLPILGISLAFWVLGNAMALFVHVFYTVLKNAYPKIIN
jgi:hypothetical protein